MRLRRFTDPAKDLKVSEEEKCNVKEHGRLVIEDRNRKYPYFTFGAQPAILSCNHLAVVHLSDENRAKWYGGASTNWRTNVEPPEGTVSELTDAVVHCEVCNKPRHAIKTA